MNWDVFIDNLRAQLEANGADEATIDAAVLAAGQAKLKLSGAAVGTVMKNSASKATAMRMLNGEGTPMWKVTLPDGSSHDDMQAVLQPADQWVKVAGPDEDDD